MQTQFFVQLPSEAQQRVLHPAVLVARHGQNITARLQEEDFVLEPGQDVFIYYEKQRDFVKQMAHVTAIMDGERDEEGDEDADGEQEEAATLVGLEVTGDAVSAESRSCFRVATVMYDLVAQVNDQACSLTDVSVLGFSIISPGTYAIGSEVEVVLKYEDQQFAGSAFVQSVKEISAERTRYGLLCRQNKSSGRTELERGLQKISMEVQRQQLRRRAGAVGDGR